MCCREAGESSPDDEDVAWYAKIVVVVVIRHG